MTKKKKKTKTVFYKKKMFRQLAQKKEKHYSLKN